MTKPWCIEGILFDLEGTCIDMENHHAKAFSDAAAHYGITVSASEILRMDGYVGAGDPRAIQIILSACNREDIDHEEFRLRKMEFYEKSLLGRPPVLRVGLPEFFKKAKKRGFRLAIASLTPRIQAAALFDGAGLSDYIPSTNMVVREDVVNVKPDPEVFAKAAQMINVDPRKTLAFGDSKYDMESARAAHSTPIAMPCNWNVDTIAGLVGAGATHVFRDWRTVDLDGLIDIAQS